MPARTADPVSALRALQTDLDLDPADITSALEEALVVTYRRLVEDDPRVRARVDAASGSWALYRPHPEGEETLAVDVPDFLRQAAVTARHAVASRVQHADARRVLHQAAEQHGQLIDAIVDRPAGPAWYVDAAGVPGYLPPEEQLPGERLRPHQHLKVIVIEGRRRVHDAVVIVSRSHPLLLQRLLEQEVPELQNGQVVIRGIARQPGRRTKVAVEAPAGDIDAQGACIGPRGVRQRAVTSELGEEQVQIVAWSGDPATYVGNALIPATVLSVELDHPTNTARVEVPADQLSLAIGRGGENARLAHRLTGWRIDIHAPGAG